MAHLALAVVPRMLAYSLVLALGLLGQAAQAAPAEPAVAPPPVAIGRLSLDDASANDRIVERGLAALLTQVQRRTTLALGDKALPVKLELPSLLNRPLIVWHGEGQRIVLCKAQREALRTLLAGGGTLWVDAADGDIAGAFATSVRDELNGLFPGSTLRPLPNDFVLLRSFYLLRGQLGRKAVPTPVRGLFRDKRLVALVTEGDVLGAIATREDGSYLRPIEGTEEVREMALRLGINWLMYAMCLDYKDDQVHLPFILKRRSL